MENDIAHDKILITKLTKVNPLVLYQLLTHIASHTHLYINNTLNVYLINEILEQSLTLLTFFLNQ